MTATITTGIARATSSAPARRASIRLIRSMVAPAGRVCGVWPGGFGCRPEDMRDRPDPETGFLLLLLLEGACLLPPTFGAQIVRRLSLQLARSLRKARAKLLQR